MMISVNKNFIPEIAVRKLYVGLFCHPFADPSHKLRASAQDSVWPSFFVILLFLSFWTER